jgi:hypothetical protein
MRMVRRVATAKAARATTVLVEETAYSTASGDGPVSLELSNYVAAMCLTTCSRRCQYACSPTPATIVFHRRISDNLIGPPRSLKDTDLFFERSRIPAFRPVMPPERHD